MKELVMTLPHIMPRPITQMQTRNVNVNMKREPKREHDCCKTSMRQRNITTRHNMMRHIITPDDQTIKK